MDLGFGSVLVVIFKQVDPKHYCGNYNSWKFPLRDLRFFFFLAKISKIPNFLGNGWLLGKSHHFLTPHRLFNRQQGQAVLRIPLSFLKQVPYYSLVLLSAVILKYFGKEDPRFSLAQICGLFMPLFVLGCHSLHATLGLIQADFPSPALFHLSFDLPIIKRCLYIRFTPLKNRHCFEEFHVMQSYKLFWKTIRLLKMLRLCHNLWSHFFLIAASPLK